MGNQLIARWRWRGETTTLHPLQEQVDKQELAAPEGNPGKFTQLGSIFRAASSARKSWRKARNQRNPTGSDALGGEGDESFATADQDLLPGGADDSIIRRKVHHFEKKDTIKANWMNEGDIGSEPEGNQVRLGCTG